MTRKEKMSEGKKNISASLIQEYDIHTAKDIEDAPKDLLGGTIQNMMSVEMNHPLSYEYYKHSDNTNARNGHKPKPVRSKYGEFPVEVPQDRESSFEPLIACKRQKDTSQIDDKIIAMYIKNLTTR